MFRGQQRRQTKLAKLANTWQCVQNVFFHILSKKRRMLSGQLCREGLNVSHFRETPWLIGNQNIANKKLWDQFCIILIQYLICRHIQYSGPRYSEFSLLEINKVVCFQGVRRGSARKIMNQQGAVFVSNPQQSISTFPLGLRLTIKLLTKPQNCGNFI